MGLTVMVTPRPATYWTSYCRRTPTPAPDQPPQAQWAQDPPLDRAQDPAQAVTAVVPQLVEPQAAEQVS